MFFATDGYTGPDSKYLKFIVFWLFAYDINTKSSSCESNGQSCIPNAELREIIKCLFHVILPFCFSLNDLSNISDIGQVSTLNQNYIT
jgi:hypothetical protein